MPTYIMVCGTHGRVAELEELRWARRARDVHARLFHAGLRTSIIAAKDGDGSHDLSPLRPAPDEPADRPAP